MSTDQSYDPQHTPANPIEPAESAQALTANTALPTPFTPDERLARIFASQGANEYLEQLLSRIQEFKDTAHPISAINAIFRKWTNGRSMSAQELTDSFGRILELLQFLDELASYHDCILIESDNEQQF